MKGIPALVPCTIEPMSTQFALQRLDESNRPIGRELIIDRDEAAVVQSIDGVRGLRDIDEHLRSKGDRVGLSRLVLTLQKLLEGGFLREGFHLDQSEVEATTDLHFSESWWLKAKILHRFRVRLAVPQAIYPQTLFFALVGVLLCLAAFAGWVLLKTDFGSFLQIDGTYHYAIPLLLMLLAILTIARSLIHSALIVLGGETIRDPWIGLRGCLPAFGVSAAHMECRENRLDLMLYGVTSGLTHLSVVGGFLLLSPDDMLGTQALIVAVVLTLLELNPYRNGDLTRLFRHFYEADELRHLIPYLRNRAFFTGLFQKQDSHNEDRLLIYASIATAWTVLFILFAQALIVANWAKWVTSINVNDLINSASACGVAACVFGVFAVLVSDLLRTLGLNVIQPIRAAVADRWRNWSSAPAQSVDEKQLLELLKDIPFLKSLGQGDIERLASSARLVSLPANTPVMIQGEIGQDMGLLIRGQLEVVREETTGLKRSLARLEVGAVFGEQSVFQHIRRTATILTCEPSVICLISREAFESALAPTLATGQVDRGDLVNQLAASSSLSSSPLFRDVPAEALSAFVRRGHTLEVESGQTIVREGDRDDALYIIIRGSVDVSIGGSPAATLPQGNCFGEIAVLTGAPRNATITSNGPGVLLRIERDMFWEAITSHAGLAVRIETLAHERSRASA